ncbi:proteasome subunit alpha [Verrucomicrobia bacterium LW23]|nr:proteasome subunit alpha [Verrucomicrobia bacterium LW23]
MTPHLPALAAPVASGPASSFSGDFFDLLRRTGTSPFPDAAALSRAGGAPGAVTIGHSPSLSAEATTVISFHFRDGVVIAGDRRATAGHTIMYDRADKVIEIDADTVMAIAGTPATAFEMARTLAHSFQYYRRSQLQPLSLEAKVRALGRLIRENLAMTLQGVGMVVPILAAQHRPGLDAALGAGAAIPPTLYFYDALGAQFLAVDHAMSGSGSPAARSVLNYINRWSGKLARERDEREAIALALQLLEVAAETDTATGGIDRRTHIYPQVKVLTAPGGTRDVSVEEMREVLPGI